MTESTRQRALEYARNGLAVFPLRRGQKTPTVKWRDVATSDVAEIEDAWADDTCNIGIACGTKSNGLFVVDVDCHDGGADGMGTLREWERANGELPETATAITGSGGMHLLYRSGKPIRNAANGDAGIDIRGEGGFVVAPPSVHPNGNPYVWEYGIDERRIAEADENVLAFVESICGGAVDGGQWRKLELPDKPIHEGEGRNDTLYRLVCSYRARSYERSDAHVLASEFNRTKCAPPLDEREFERTFASAFDGHEAGRSDAFLVRGDGKPGEIELLPVKSSIDNCIRVLMNDESLASRFFYDVRGHTKMVQCPLPWDEGSEDARPIRDGDYAWLCAYLESRYGQRGKQNAVDAVRAVCDVNRRNLLVEWLDGLRWDGRARMDSLLTRYLGVEYNDYTVAVMRLLMAGAIARAYEPGTKFDYMPVLVGKQGKGKSRFVQLLAVRDEWFTDNLNCIDGDKGAEKIRGLWIAEMAELLAVKSARGIESIKAFITSRVDVYRPPYGHETEQWPRGCVFVGSTNDLSFLTDMTGNRRFLPVECMKREPLESMYSDGVEEVFVQAWAEALVKWRAGELPLVLDEKASESALEMQERYLEDVPVAGVVEDYCTQRIKSWELTDMTKPLRVCAAEIESVLPDEVKRGTTYRATIRQIRDVLNRLDGWEESEKKQHCGKWGVQRCFAYKAS